MELTNYKKNLIARFLENKCTPEEKHELYEMLLAEENEKSFKEEIYSHLDEIQTDNFINHSADFERIYEKIISQLIQGETKELEMQKLKRRMRVKKLVFEGMSIAAVLCIVFFMGTITGNHDTNTTADQSKNITYSEIKAPLGARSEITLNDGTEVMLNAGSSIKYGSDYNSLNRDLILEGEAYFKVAKNKDLPLIVSAGNIKIKATGTEFNVKAYSDEGIIETTLVEGEVEISQKGNIENRILVLEPNQKAIFANQADQFTLERIKEIEPLVVIPAKISTDKLLVSPKTNVEQATAWTKNKLIIRSENLESLCAKLQRKYDVTFIFKDEEIKKDRFSGILLDETFQQVMDVIKLTAPVDYVLDGKTVMLISNKNQKE